VSDALADVEVTAQLLVDLSVPWFFCGGWAVDLFVGATSRPHKDVDVAIWRRDQLAVQRYLSARGWRLEKAINGELILWEPGEYIELPTHVIWCKRQGAQPSFVEVLFNEIDGATFCFRRDSTVRRALNSAVVHLESGYSVLAPEICLLYKAPYDEEEHDADFYCVLPYMNPDQCAWLRAGLEKLNPGHRWLEAL